MQADSVGASQIQDNSIAQAAMQAASVGAAQLKANSIAQAAMQANSVGAAQLKAASIAQAAMQANSIGAAQMQAGSVGASQMQANSIAQAALQAASVGAAQLKSNAVTKASLAPDVTSSLYVHNEPDTSITTDTLLGTLTLPAGTYFVTASTGGVNNDVTNATRFECWLANGATLIDYGKVRLEANTGATSLIFAKMPMNASLTLAAPGTVTLNCTSVNGTSVGLADIHLMALRVAEIVPQ
jgi:hypothetical protein